MNRSEAYLFYEMVDQRLFGWTTPLSFNPRTGHSDARTKNGRAAHDFFADMVLCRANDIGAALDLIIAGKCLSEQWPKSMREVIHFRINHRVPRDENEPTSAVSIADRLERGLAPFPEWILAHGSPATVEDHPEYPSHSALFKERQLVRALKKVKP